MPDIRANFYEPEFLDNGARVLGRMRVNHYQSFVLCHWEQSTQPYVTWMVDNDGNAECGHYFGKDDLEEAKADFADRCGISSKLLQGRRLMV